MGWCPRHHCRHIFLPLPGQIWLVVVCYINFNQTFRTNQSQRFVSSSAGLRKLEAFFGLLITVMAVTFGYEVPTFTVPYLFQ